jgi:hypothetical protein
MNMVYTASLQYAEAHWAVAPKALTAMEKGQVMTSGCQYAPAQPSLTQTTGSFLY